MNKSVWALIFLKSRLTRFLKKNASRKKVIIINSYDKIDILAEVIKNSLNYFGTNTTILCFKSKIPGAFSDFADKVTISEDYLTYEDYLKIDNYVFNDISKNWDREAMEKARYIFTYESVKLARIAEYDFQQFLITKIKALAVFNRAIKKENYRAIFIIDSNGELGRFDKLLRKHYGVVTDFAGINEKESLIDLTRKKISGAISNMVDNFAFCLVQNKNKAKLIDAKLFYELGIKKPDNFILVPFEKGLRLRLKALFRNRGYVAFDLDSDKRKATEGKLAPAGCPERQRGERCFPASSFAKASEDKSPQNKFDIKNLADKFIFENIPYWMLVEDKIRELVLGAFTRFRNNIERLTNVRNSYNIKGIVLRNDVRELQKTIVLALKTSRIPSLVIQHGMLAEHNGHNSIYADKLAAWGNRAVRWYGKYGNNLRKIAVVGNSNFDSIFYYKNTGKEKSSISRKYFAKEKPLVTLIGPGISMLKLSSFTTDDVTDGLIRNIIKAIKSIGNVNLLIKLHPNEKVKTYAKLIKPEDKDAISIVERVDLPKIIKASDVIITRQSTAALMAVIMRKPIVLVNLEKRSSLVPYVDDNVAIGAYGNGEIEDAIRKALYDENVKYNMDLAKEDFINDLLYKTDGRSGERVLKLIDSF